MIIFRKLTIACTLAVLLPPLAAENVFSASSALYSEEPFLDSKGQAIFLARFYKNGPRLFSKNEEEEIKMGFAYWADILESPRGKPLTIAVKSMKSDRDAHYEEKQNLLKVLSGVLSSHKTADGTIRFNLEDASVYLGDRSHLPPDGQKKLRFFETTVHEIGHGLFEPDLHSYKGGPVNLKNKTFGGAKALNVNAVLESDKPGADLQRIPLHKDGAHIELKNSLMSHQSYRNYSIFMEAELALLQDVGWSIDRRNFYGYSLYRNFQAIDNTNGYFARNLEGTAYLQGIYNEKATGVGLHIYGSFNRVTQKADILTEGSRAVGARVDGESNTLIIDKGVNVHANGSDGIGVLFAYGTYHDFILNGELKATGARGVGLSFDFGGNMLGVDSEERGSYFRFIEEKLGKTPAQTLPDHNGPLAREVVIKGLLSGGGKAIYMSKSGFVDKITITPEAWVKGDIISEYSQKKDFSGNLYLTSLIFGPEKSTDNVEGQKFIYTGNIQGKNLDIHFTGPYTALYGGQHHVYSATIASGATLGGNSTFASSKGFTNSGTLSPSSAEIETFTPEANIGTITIDGDFQQTHTGKLIIDVSKKGTSDLLYVTGTASLDGTLEVRPERGFYPTYWRSEIPFLKTEQGIQGDFSQKTMSPSPTLMWNFVKTHYSYSLTSPFKKAGTLLVVEEEKNTESDLGLKGDQPSTPEPISRSFELQDTTPNQEREALAEQASQEGTVEDAKELVAHHSNTEPLRPDPTEESMANSLSKKKNKAPESSKEQTRSTNQASLTSVNQQHSNIDEALVVNRQVDAYSQYATNVNERSMGRVLDRVVDQADKPLQDLYETLDFSAPDGSDVRLALAQLSPVAYGGTFGASLTREQQISDTLNERPSVALTPGQWQAFAFPFISQTSSKARELQVGTTLRTTGLIAGLEHQPSSKPGLTWGVHGVVGNKASLTLNTSDNARGSLEAWGVGMHLRYQPDLLAGPYLSAQARMGLEQGTLARTFAVNGYKGQQQGKWQGATATASFLGGTLWKVHDHLSIGPLLGLDYTVLTHPTIREKGPSGISLTLEKARHHSLQSSLGIRGVVFITQTLKVDLQARWDRQLLSTTRMQKAHFTHTPDSAFITKTRLAPRDAFNVSGQATYEVSPTVTLGARASGQFARSQKPNLMGNLSLSVKF